MSDRTQIDWTKIPKAPPNLRALYESGHGEWSGNTEGEGPYVIMYGVSMKEMEAMGPEERARLGLEAIYQFGLAHPPQE